MQILLRTSSNDEDFNGDCDYGVVEMDKGLAELILKRAEFFKTAKAADDDLYELYFWNYACRYVSDDSVGDLRNGKMRNEARKSVDSTGWAKVKMTFSDDNFQRTEADQMIIREDGVLWTCLVKHTDVYITTDAIKLSDIEEMLKEMQPPQQSKKWEIWSEGFTSVGGHAPPHFWGYQTAPTFEEACRKLSKESKSFRFSYGKDGKLFDSQGCELFDNEKDARKRIE